MKSLTNEGDFVVTTFNETKKFGLAVKKIRIRIRTTVKEEEVLIFIYNTDYIGTEPLDPETKDFIHEKTKPYLDYILRCDISIVGKLFPAGMNASMLGKLVNLLG